MTLRSRSLATAAAFIGVGLAMSPPGLAILTTAVPTSSLAAQACGAAAPTVEGTAGDDNLSGTPGVDVIFGYGGDDSIDGLGGEDLLCGGRGADVLFGGSGDDRLFGQADRVGPRGESDSVHWGDRLVGGEGADLLDVGQTVEPEYVQPEVVDFSDLPAAVVIDLPAGSATSNGDIDEITGFRGVLHDRRIIGTRYGDRLIGTRDDDDLRGRRGDDVIHAGDGGDWLEGGAGDDRLFGQGDHDGSRDPYEPGSGGDVLRPGFGDDLVAPGARGSGPGYAFYGDTVWFAGDRGVWVDLREGTASWQGNDDLRIRGPITLVGTPADDLLQAGPFDEIVVGLGDDDVLWGGGGDDELYGEGDHFRFTTGRGHGPLLDQSFPGNDGLHAGAGSDLLDGGAMADGLGGGPGRDSEYDRPNINDCHGIERVQRSGC